MVGDQKEVFFHKFCPGCIFEAESEFDVTAPCFECLEQPVNQDTHKPVNWQEAEVKDM